MSAALYPGESIEHAAGYPILVRFEKGNPDSPLVVFMTGGGVLARIAYGHPGGLPADFLNYWLNREGFSTLALSYPMGHGAFERAYPAFGVHDWAEQSAEIIARCRGAHKLPKKIIVLAWSMAGRVTEPLTQMLHHRNVEVELFVAMAASPALPNLLPGLAALRPAATGLARIEGGYLTWLLQCLLDQSKEAGHTIISPDLFVAEFTGDFPIGLAASAMRYEGGAFVHAPQRDAKETGAFSYSQYPTIAVMTHASPIDARHAIMDRSVWGLYISQQLSETYLFGRMKDVTALRVERWIRIIHLIHGAPERLTLVLPGNHMFFVGEAGAAKTVEALKWLRSAAASIVSELDEAVR